MLNYMGPNLSIRTIEKSENQGRFIYLEDEILEAIHIAFKVLYVVRDAFLLDHMVESTGVSTRDAFLS